MRVQFELDAALWDRASRYISDPKMRHMVAHDAFEEWVTRREGRDKKFQKERLASDAELMRPVIQQLIDDGFIQSRQ